jgi:hypothetical protein
MFEKLNQEKIMYFGNRPELTYQNAFKDLATKIGKSDATPTELEGIILTALKNTAIQFNQGKSNSPDYVIVMAFHIWVQSIHNINLIPPKGERFPNNIVFDMLKNLRDEHSLSPEETLLRFFLEGANGRKISKGNTPNLSFIATTLQIDAIDALRKAGEKISETANNFIKKYEDLRNYVSPQRQIENELTKLKDESALYRFLSTTDIFNFKRALNEKTGANFYDIEKAIQDGMSMLHKYDGQLNIAVNEMVDSINKVYPSLVSSLEQAQIKSAAESHVLAMWDASEWFSRLYVALNIAAKYDQKYEIDLERFRENKLVADIISRSKTGNFPANERDQDLAKVEIKELFTQEQIARAAAVQTYQASPTYPNTSSNWHHPSNPQTQDTTGQPVIEIGLVK